jgi:hypothetical protein
LSSYLAFLSLLPSAQASLSSQPSSSAAQQLRLLNRSTKELRGWHAGNQQSEISFVALLYCIAHTHVRQWQTWRHWPAVSRALNCFFCVAAGSPITWARGLEGMCSLLFEDHPRSHSERRKKGARGKRSPLSQKGECRHHPRPDARIINTDNVYSWLLTLDS